MARVFILASVGLYREGLTQCLTGADSISVVGDAADLPSALNQLRDLHPDVVVIDLGMPHGPLAARVMRHDHPSVKIVALAVSDASADILFWAQAGVSGYVTREQSIADLVSAIELAAGGEVVCPPRLVAILLYGLATQGYEASAAKSGSHSPLTTREHEIAQLIAQGMSNKEIARLLSIALPTVKNHVHNVLRKLQVDHRSDAARRVRHPEDSSS